MSGVPHNLLAELLGEDLEEIFDDLACDATLKPATGPDVAVRALVRSSSPARAVPTPNTAFGAPPAPNQVARPFVVWIPRSGAGSVAALTSKDRIVVPAAAVDLAGDPRTLSLGVVQLREGAFWVAEARL